MSGIYIPCMEMPKGCAECRFYGEYCYAKGDENKRSKLPCPLVPVPEHGDLIDRNALPWEKQGKMLTDPDEWGLKATDIEDAPTIIPADKEGEE